MLKSLKHSLLILATVALCTMQGVAVAQNTVRSPAPTGGPPAGETRAVVKPLIKPEAIDAPAAVDRAVRQLVVDLGKENELLRKRQSDIAACHEMAKVSPPGRGDSIICLTEPAAATRASWMSIGKTLQAFDAEMIKVNTRLAEARHTVRETVREQEAEEAQLKARVASDLTKIRQLEALLDKGGRMTAAEEDDAWKRIDDVRTVKARIEVVAHGRASIGKKLAALDTYAERIADVRRNVDRRTHSSANRADFWGAILKDLERRAPIAAIEQGFGNTDFGGLGVVLETLKGQAGFDLPASLTTHEEPAEPAQPLLPRTSIAEEIKRLLQAQ